MSGNRAAGFVPGEPLLSADDPHPVEVLRPQGRSVFVLTCEHAGRLLPRRLGSLGLAENELQRHIAWDIGAAAVATRLAEALDACLFLQRYSRLVVDCNRATHADDFITALSEATRVPGNLSVTREEVDARTHEVYHPYHSAIREALDGRDRVQCKTVLVSVHSCTPVFHGEHRPWHVGVLYEHDARYATALLDVLNDAAHGGGDILVGDNRPYRLDSRRDYAVPVHGQARGYLHVELEIRQDLIEDAQGQAQWAERLARILPLALQRLVEDE